MEFISWTLSPCFRSGGISSSSSFAHWWWQTVVFLGSASETNYGPMSYGGWAPWSKRTSEPLTKLGKVVGMTSTLLQRPLPAVCWGVWGDWGGLFLRKVQSSCRVQLDWRMLRKMILNRTGVYVPTFKVVSKTNDLESRHDTVDGQNPAPPGMYKTL